MYKAAKKNFWAPDHPVSDCGYFGRWGSWSGLYPRMAWQSHGRRKEVLFGTHPRDCHAIRGFLSGRVDQQLDTLAGNLSWQR